MYTNCIHKQATCFSSFIYAYLRRTVEFESRLALEEKNSSSERMGYFFVRTPWPVLERFEVSPAGSVGAKRSPPESSAPSRAWKCEAVGDKGAWQPPRKVPLNTVFGGGWNEMHAHFVCLTVPSMCSGLRSRAPRLALKICVSTFVPSCTHLTTN